MAKGKNAEKYGHPGREYWSRRYPNGADWNKFGKKLTHRYERRQRKRIAREAVWYEVEIIVNPAK